MFDPSMPPLIPETLLKKRRSLEELAVVRAETVGRQTTKKRIRGEDIKLKRPEKFLMEYRIRQGSLNKMNRRKSQIEKKTKSDLVPKSSMKKTVGVAIRIHGGRHSSKVIKAQLDKLGLKSKYDAIFFKLDRDGIGILRIVFIHMIKF